VIFHHAGKIEKIFKKISEDIPKNMTEEKTVKLIHDTHQLFRTMARRTTLHCQNAGDRIYFSFCKSFYL